jgi:hypothetical protein
MKSRVYVAIAAICAALFAFSCSSTNNVASGGGRGDCRFEGIVMDMRGLDGCGLMIVLNDSAHTRLQPVVLTDTSFHLQPGQRVRVNYTELHDRMSNCMSGKLVRIDCIKAQ